MRRLLLTTIALGLMLSCSNKAVNTGGTGYGFEGKRIYQVAVFPVLVRGSATPDDSQRDTLYTHLEDRLLETGRFELVDRVLVEFEADSPGALSPDDARQAGKKLGADVVCLSSLTLEKASPPLVLAKVDILPVEGKSPSYTGSGRAGDPDDWLAAARLALDSATAGIVK